ncbi:uncharacterized protein LOC108680434, partial [Hyalella azteca]|uniref:Uncharacterized protein LOC108680434 n=1 Tax=Hyalella azteca TaxID=294128 RepID=A0A8B7PFG8_HYAAZ
MSCPNATGDPAPEVTWAIQSTVQVAEGQTQLTFFKSNRTVVGPDGTAYFTHVIAEDDSDVSNILYICLGVSEIAPQDYSLGTTVKLKVVPPRDGIENANKTNLNIEPFLMYGSPNKTLFRGGQENRLWCIFGG